MTGSKIAPSTQLVTRLESDMGEIISCNFKRFWLAPQEGDSLSAMEVTMKFPELVMIWASQNPNSQFGGIEVPAGSTTKMAPGWSGYTGDYATQKYGDYDKPL